MAQVTLETDDNLQGGLTYTFSFTSCNLLSYLIEPSVSNILADLANHAPSFISSPQVSWANQLITGDVLNITFNYTGDGSDVVSDVANEIIASANDGSNDCLSFVQATTGTSGVSSLNDLTTGTSQVAGAVGTGLGNIAGGITQGAASGLTSNLGASGWIVIVLVILGILAYFSAATGIRAPRST
jgi:hypothetical protein